jgi:hypothetical protein
MTIHEFAARYRLRIETTPDGEQIIPSNKRRFHHCHIYQHSLDGSVFALILAAVGPEELPRGYAERQKGALQALGSQISQRGDNEAIFLFDPENEALTHAICRAGKISRRRFVSLTDEQKAVLRERIGKINSLRKGAPNQGRVR